MKHHHTRSHAQRLLSLAMLIGSALGASTTAVALNGYTYITPCTSCSTLAQFRSAGLAKALQLAFPGVYVVSSEQSPRSGYVKVTGTRRLVCEGPDGHGPCVFELADASATVVTATGSTAVLADLERIDAHILGVSRASGIRKLRISSNYASSFINSLDEEVGPGISQRLVGMGINPGNLPVGTIVLVVFADGTSAQFIKISNSTLMWQWTGLAWDSDGNLIKRNGTAVSNPNTSGSGGGHGNYYVPQGGSSSPTFSVGGGSLCIFVTTVSQTGEPTAVSRHIAPC